VWLWTHRTYTYSHTVAYAHNHLLINTRINYMHYSHVYAWSNLGTVLREMGELEQSVAAHTRVGGWVGLWVGIRVNRDVLVCTNRCVFMI
jgi:hypothetical protein